MKIGITGCNGFVGRALSQAALAQGHAVVGIVSREGACAPAVAEWATTKRDFASLLGEAPGYGPIDCIIHLASRVHELGEGRDASTLLPLYRETNVAGSLRVAAAAYAVGAKRLVFVSSIKAMGEAEPGSPPRPWTETDTAVPSDPYGISKCEAEQALRETCARLGLELIIIRPPLVYGPGVRANFLQLMSFVARGVPLPLASVRAQRSMVFIDNLVGAILAAASHAKAPGHAFLVSDGQDMSVAEITHLLGDGLGSKARLIPVPPVVLMYLARAIGKQALADRLLKPLRVNIDHIRNTLDWQPPIDAQIGLRRTAIWYRGSLASQA
jgi:UDP-glucose 4-epimerase